MKDLIHLGTYRDGGTTSWIEPSVKAGLKTVEDMKNCQIYYLDYRIHTTTRGELFDRYPKDNEAKMLDKTQFNFLEHKE